MYKISMVLLSASVLFLSACSDESKSSKELVATKSVLVNDAPIATFDRLTIDKDKRYEGQLTAIDSDGDVLKYTIVKKPQHGTIMIDENGCFTYTPKRGYQGSDNFSYKVSDDISSCAIKEVTVNICKPTITTPTPPSNLKVKALSTTAVVLTWHDNADNEQGYLIYQDGKLIASTEANEIKKIISCGLKPNTTYSFEVKAKNEAGTSQAATAKGTTKDVTTPPTAPTELKAKAISKTSLRLVWKDNADNESGYEIYQDTKRLKTISSECNCTVVNNLKEGTTYHFTIKAINKIGSASSNTIMIETKSDVLVPTNTAPIASAQSVTLKQDTNKTIILSGTDEDNDTLTYTVVTPPIHGIFKDNIYTPEKNYHGKDSFTFIVNDTKIDSAPATVSIMIEKVEVINGYTLPPEPDPKINNATLLGVDSNDNGVRDDVERYIVYRFDNKAERSIAFQTAKALQKVAIVTDEQSALEAMDEWDRARDCNWYYWDKNTKDMVTYREGALYRKAHAIFNPEFKDEQFNTRERIRAYFSYNKNLSGKVLGGGGGIISSTKDKCDDDIDGLE